MTLRRIGFAAVALGALVAAACGSGGDGGESAAGSPTTEAEGETPSYAGTQPAPEFAPGLTWFNVQAPLTLAELRGKIVLLDFWTQGCINCQHIIPDLKRLEAEYGDQLVVIGVHSGKYSEEQDDAAVQEAIDRFQLEHPVVNDPDFIVWRNWGARAWPTIALIDPAGNVVGVRAGEGVYAAVEPVIAGLANEFAEEIDLTPIPIALTASVASTFLSFPAEVLVDEAGGRIFIADAGHNRIVVADLDGRVIAGVGSGEAGFADGAAREAMFRDPQGLELSADGETLWVADTRNHAVRAVDLETLEVRTVAGTGEQSYELAPGSSPDSTSLGSPWDVHEHEGVLYVAMAGTHQIWTVDLASGEVAIFAGTRAEGIADGDRLTEATLAQPSGITGNGEYLYWVDPESSSLRRVPFEGQGDVETLIGSGLLDWGDTDGAASAAQLQHAQGLVLAGDTVYIADTYNHKLRVLDLSDSVVSSLTGQGERGWVDGPLAEAAFEEPNGLDLAGDRLYVADTGSHVIRVVELAAGRVSTLALTNLGAATPPAAGQILQIEAMPQEVAPGVSTLRLTLVTPSEYHLNSAAPSRIELASSNPAVELGEHVLQWSSDEPSIELPIPVILADGSALVTGTGNIYYCRDGEEALCLIQPVEIIVPVTVTDGSNAGEIAVEVTLPVGDATYGDS